MTEPKAASTTERGVAFVLVLIGVGLRTQLTRTPLWLDEAQSVAVAELPLGSMIDALRADGHPPLYYWILHGWMSLVGESDSSIRALSALIGVAAVGALGLVARRLGGDRLMLITVALASVSPFMVRYGTEVRMYALVSLLVALWWLAVDRKHLPAVAVLTAALALTHYWAMFLFAAWLIVGGWRDIKLLGAHIVGGLAFLAWVPHLLYQLEHTGTPWAQAPGPRALVTQTLDAVGGSLVPGLALALLVALGLRHREIWPLAWLTAVPFVLAVAVITVMDTAYAGRYLAIIVGFSLIIAARGIDHPAVLLIVGLALGVGSWSAVNDVRSQGQEVAGSLPEAGIVVVCPDQIGPAITRYTDASVLSYPLLTDARRVDWVDYTERHAVADPAAVADQLVALADGQPILLAWREGYRTLENQCTDLYNALTTRMLPPESLLSADPDVFEPMRLDRFDSPS